MWRLGTNKGVPYLLWWERFVYVTRIIHLNMFSDGDEGRRKIKVEIRPLSPTTAAPAATVEDLKASMEGLRLSPPSVSTLH